MTVWTVAVRGLFFHWRVNLAIAAGVAAATAVLCGALIVGDSMRGSLRDLAMDRLGRIDSMIMADGFFRSGLADQVQGIPGFDKDFDSAIPVIFFPGGYAQRGDESPRGQVNLIGIRDGFWQLGDERVDSLPVPREGEIVINSVLASDLGISESEVNSGSARITIGVPRQQLLPADSSLGNKDRLIERIVDLRVIAIAPASSLGRFGIHPSQVPPRNAWLSAGEFQSALREGILEFKSDPDQVNMILIGSSRATPSDEDATRRLVAGLQPSLEDLGIALKRVTRTFANETVFDYWSLSSDRLVFDDEVAQGVRDAFPGSIELFVYLSNDIRPEQAGGTGVPFSVIAGASEELLRQLPTVEGGFVSLDGESGIAITRWVAEDQNLKPGDMVEVEYFEPETTHGEEVSQTTLLKVASIVELATPATPYRATRRGEVSEAVFDVRPTRANDPDATPVVPGLTDAESIERWELPFATADRIRQQDEDYWDNFRTTPKAWVSLETARRLWSSRFGKTTTFQLDSGVGTAEEIQSRLLARFRKDGHLAGMQLIPVRRNGLDASAGTTPFDGLFLGLSLFVVVSALALVAILFRLALQQRANEIGVMMASGMGNRLIRRIWFAEMAGICVAGALPGAALGVAYAALMLYGLRTWWVGAVGAPFLELHIRPWTLPVGLLSGVVVCLLTLFWVIRVARGRQARELLSGEFESTGTVDEGLLVRHARSFAILAIALAVLLAVLAGNSLGGESQAGAFMSSGALVLVAALLLVWKRLVVRHRSPESHVSGRARLAMTSVARNPLRSALAIGLIAVASFLILAISAFRLSPAREGTAGFSYLATTTRPLLSNWNSADGRRELFGSSAGQLAGLQHVLSFRLKPGQDASCNNLYQATQPQVLGVTPDAVSYFDDVSHERFAFTMTSAENPWRLLEEEDPEGAVPVLIDKNTAWYSLKIYLPGSRFTMEFDSGEKVTFRLAGLLSNSVLQGTIMVSEENFTRLFPQISGYRWFLIKTAEGEAGQAAMAGLSSLLSDAGLEWTPAERLLEGFLSVQNTYLGTFQSLGLLGLLLGTVGLAAVQLRSVLERRRELGLMRALGFSRKQLAGLIVLENVFLLMAGLAIGIGAALVTVIPHFLFGNAAVPWTTLAAMLGFVSVVGVFASLVATRGVFRLPLVQSLRAA